jgi:hypothetical protein
VLKFNYSYDLPIGRGKAFLGNMPRVVDAVVGGWRTAGIWTLSDGRPLTLTTSGIPIPTYGAPRPNLTGELKRNYGPDWVDNFFANPQVLQVPANYTMGDVPRATAEVRTPLFFTTDLSLIKEFLLSNVHEGVRMELRLEAQNAFNHPLFSIGGPGGSTTTVGDPSFGVLTSMAPVGPRQMQLALKISF